MDEKAQYQDKLKYSNIWIEQISRIMKERTFREFGHYKRGLSILISSLFKNMRQEVEDYVKTLDPEMDEEEYYDIIFEFVVDLLTDAGYLKHSGRDIELGVESK